MGEGSGKLLQRLVGRMGEKRRGLSCGENFAWIPDQSFSVLQIDRNAPSASSAGQVATLRLRSSRFPELAAVGMNRIARESFGNLANNWSFIS